MARQGAPAEMADREPMPITMDGAMAHRAEKARAGGIPPIARRLQCCAVGMAVARAEAAPGPRREPQEARAVGVAEAVRRFIQMPLVQGGQAAREDREDSEGLVVLEVLEAKAEREAGLLNCGPRARSRSAAPSPRAAALAPVAVLGKAACPALM